MYIYIYTYTHIYIYICLRPESMIVHKTNVQKILLFITNPSRKSYFLRIWAWDLAQMLDHPHLFFGGLNESSGGLK